MNTGNTSKTALAAARIALLAGVSAFAFAGAAYAQDTVGIDVVPGAAGSGFTSATPAYTTQLAGGYLASYQNGTTNFTTIQGSTITTGFDGAYESTLTINGTSTGGNSLTATANGVTQTNSFSNNAIVTNNVGNTYAGFVANVGYTSQSVVTSGIGTYGTNAAGATTYFINSSDGSAQFAAQGVNGGVQIFGNGNVNLGNGVTVQNGAAINGGANVTGGLTVSGGATFNGATDTTKVNAAGDITITNNAHPATQNTVITSDGATFTGATVTVTNGTVAGTTTINNGVVTAGTAVVTPNVLANNVLANNVGIASNLAVANGANVNLGDNVVHGVAAPIVGTDAANKAYVDTNVGKARNQAYEGTAVALAISQPILANGQTFAIRAGWGDYESESAFGVSAAGVIAHDVFGYGSTVTLDGGVGVGTNYNGVGGKAGVTFGFGGVAPLK